MIKRIILIALPLISLFGCAAGHYVERTPTSSTLFLRLSDASRVQFASSVDNYLLHDISQNSFGVWQITLPSDSEFAYFYIVDGAAYLPECRFKETDDFGSENCLYLP